MPLLSDIVDLEWTKQQTIIKYFQKADDKDFDQNDRFSQSNKAKC